MGRKSEYFDIKKPRTGIHTYSLTTFIKVNIAIDCVR